MLGEFLLIDGGDRAPFWAEAGPDLPGHILAHKVISHGPDWPPLFLDHPLSVHGHQPP